MPTRKLIYLASLLVAVCLLTVVVASAQSVTPLCTPTIIANPELTTAAQREAGGDIAQPSLTDQADGFALPDTPLGVIKTDQGYMFFGSDGGLHSRQQWQGHPYGNNKYGSITRTLGTVDNPLGSAPPVDVTIRPNPDSNVNPYYQSYDCRGGGPVYKVPAGLPGAGNLLLVYHAEIPTVTTRSFYSVLALAASTDQGVSWTDLGEIIRVNQGYRTDIDGFDIGDSSLPTTSTSTSFFPTGGPTVPLTEETQSLRFLSRVRRSPPC